MITIQKADNPKLLREFIMLPHRLYQHDPYYVPELISSVKTLLDKKKHPFHKHSKVDYFLAYKEYKTVGRIAVIRNNNHNNYNQCCDAFFGFFDTENDLNIAQGLINKAEEWAKQEGLTCLIGPVNFSTNESCGLLVEGYDRPPSIMMPYNDKYYEQLLTSCGFIKKTDLYAYLAESENISEKSLSLSSLIEQRLKQKGITIRPINHKKFNNEILQIKEIYNKAWNRNFGFVPMTDEEFQHMAADLKMIYDPDLCFIAEHEGKMIGFALALPDFNLALQKLRNGQLFPFGIFKLLYYKQKINFLRVLTLGVIEGYRKLGVETCFYARIITEGRKKGYHKAEASWVLEGNILMNQALQKLNCKIYKKYRIYEKTL